MTDRTNLTEAANALGFDFSPSPDLAEGDEMMVDYDGRVLIVKQGGWVLWPDITRVGGGTPTASGTLVIELHSAITSARN